MIKWAEIQKKALPLQSVMINDTSHKIYFGNSNNMERVANDSIDLIVTSPPYPMIEMWDDIMSLQNPHIKDNIQSNPRKAFELMHKELDTIWNECYRVLKDGGFLCINIGDATRTINGEFELFDNHSRIIHYCIGLGLKELPCVIWRKQTNAPNKFMGSGMLPNGAYVTLEHEYILIFRKGGKRLYKNNEQKSCRRDSSFFWEERNVWFSDVWDIKGTKQSINNSISRERNASYPFELPHRLINMYSQKNDIVLDPFAGLGTTMKAAMLNRRNFVGYDIDDNLSQIIADEIDSIDIDKFNNIIKSRYDSHLEFIRDREKQKKEIKHFNKNLNCKVMTGQEEDMTFDYVSCIKRCDDDVLAYRVSYFENSDLKDLPFLTKGSLF